MTPAELVEITVADVDFGKPTAEKRGRHLSFPYVPVIDHGTRTEQVLGVAYQTREEAMDAARKMIDNRRATLARRLIEPRARLVRLQHGLPREFADLEVLAAGTFHNAGQEYDADALEAIAARLSGSMFDALFLDDDPGRARAAALEPLEALVGRGLAVSVFDDDHGYFAELTVLGAELRAHLRRTAGLD